MTWIRAIIGGIPGIAYEFGRLTGSRVKGQRFPKLRVSWPR